MLSHFIRVTQVAEPLVVMECPEKGYPVIGPGVTEHLPSCNLAVLFSKPPVLDAGTIHTGNIACDPQVVGCA